MTQFVNATFTAADGTALSSYTGETGATFTGFASFAGTPAPQVISNRLRANDAVHYWQASGANSTDGESASATIYKHTSSGSAVGVLCRVDAAADKCYLGWWIDSGTVKIYRLNTGASFVELATAALAMPSGASTMKLTVTGTGASVDVVLNVNGTDVLGISDTNALRLNSPGKVGLYLGGATTSTTGVHIDALTGENPASAGATETTLTGPSGGVNGVASTNFTVGANGAITGTVTVTPSDSSGGGTFSPTSVAINSGTPTATFTYTPGSVGTKTISISDDGGLTDATPLSYVVTAAPITVAVTDSNVFFSPYNWYSNGGGSMQANNIKGSSTYALSNNTGAYIKFKVTLATTGNISLTVDNAALSLMDADKKPVLSVFRDGQAPVDTTLTGTSSQTIAVATSLAAGTYAFTVVFRTTDANGSADSGGRDRWNTPKSSVKVTSLTIPSDASMAAPTLRSGNMAIFGDSITEGGHLLGTAATAANLDARYTWAQFLAAALDCEVGIIGFGGHGYDVTGVGNAPKLVDSWDFYYSGQSRLVGGLLTPAPTRIVVADGENDTDGSGVVTAIETTLADMRAAAGTAPIDVLVPFTGKIRTSLNSATLPSNTSLVDCQGADSDGSHLVYYTGYQTPLHPDQAGGANLAARLVPLMSPTSAGAAGFPSASNLGGVLQS